MSFHDIQVAGSEELMALGRSMFELIHAQIEAPDM